MKVQRIVDQVAQTEEERQQDQEIQQQQSDRPQGMDDRRNGRRSGTSISTDPNGSKPNGEKSGWTKPQVFPNSRTSSTHRAMIFVRRYSLFAVSAQRMIPTIPLLQGKMLGASVL